ncbi:MAG: RagB/SusD family nutrient uptake outer membrane protein [Prevotella sp.]|nr:RagB/SusD family nutrient uptake outer membrane protein [Prevotella sp.]MBP3756676.1 RagB/SusD family nutrient uptake outer membrane protein [Prevotella sp.]
MKTTYRIFCVICICFGLMGCSDFLDEQVPQATLTQDEVKKPDYIDNVLISAYAGLLSIEDMNSSFSLWNYDTRSDDAYVGGSNPSDGEPFHILEKHTTVMTTDWPYNDIWNRFYKYLSRISLSLDMLAVADQENTTIQQRTAEMKFLRAYGHFQLKRLFKKIPFVNKLNMQEDDYNNLTNTEYTNDEGWQQIINDLEDAYAVLPATQADKGRPTKAACAAFLAKVYLYKAYRQDDANSNKVTSVNEADLQKVVEYTAPGLYAGYGLESDLHNNFRPEEQYENGKESIWAIQYSKNDGTVYGNLNFSYRLIVPCIPKVHDAGCDFYKPSINLVNAYRTNSDGLPLIDNAAAAASDYEVGSAQTVDPRLFVTVGVPGTPYMFNPNFMISKSNTWSRSGGMYGYYVSLKQNVDPSLTDTYLFVCDNQWASSMNRVVFRYADVLLMRAEALAQLGKTDEAISLVNQVRSRAQGMTTGSVVANYPNKYGVHYAIGKYNGSYSKEETLKIVKMERRLELAMESERFFDLVRWGEAATVINRFYTTEGEKMNFLSGAVFTADKNEYLPIPDDQMKAANGHYTQNCGQW